MITNYLQKWTYKRGLQLIVGGYFIWNFIETEGKLSLAFGLLMSVQAILNIGCFSTKGCATSDESNTPIHPVAKNIKKIK